MIFTAIGIVFLLTLGFLVITWVAWFTFLWLSKLWYEASQTNLNRTSIRDLITNSFAVPVYLLCVFYRRTTNRISKMNDNVRILILLFVCVCFTFMGWYTGYEQCYKQFMYEQANEQKPLVNLYSFKVPAKDTTESSRYFYLYSHFYGEDDSTTQIRMLQEFLEVKYKLVKDPEYLLDVQPIGR